MLDVFDKGKDKGAVIRHQTVLKDEKGEKLATLVASRFARGDGGFGGPSEGQPEPHKVPTRAPDKTVDISTRPDQALVYRLAATAIRCTPIPTLPRRPAFRSRSCTACAPTASPAAACCRPMPITIRPPSGSTSARFSSPVYPGETVTMELWKDGNVVSFEAKVKSRNVTVIKSGKTVLG